jgi:hypothetical protein
MPVTTCYPQYLHIFDMDLGLWQKMKLGSPVSHRSQEAMNLILLEDGIPGFIGTKSELGHYVTERMKENGKGILRSWISYPRYTIMSKLGLCQNTQDPGRPELVFYGSPLTQMLAYILCPHDRKKADEEISRKGWIDVPNSEGACGPLRMFANEHSEACTYVND